MGRELPDELVDLPADAAAYVRTELARAASLRHYDYAVEGALAAADSRERAAAVTLPRLAALCAG